MRSLVSRLPLAMLAAAAASASASASASAAAAAVAAVEVPPPPVHSTGRARGAAAVSSKVARLFRWFDENGDGVFSTDEMLHRFSDPDKAGNVPAAEMPSVMSAIVQTLDDDKDGVITLHDFEAGPYSANSTVEQVHVSLTGATSKMLVMFVILGSDPVPGCTVQVQNNDGESWRSFNTTFETYAVPSRWWEPEGWQGWIYTAKVDQLEPGQTYPYQIVTPVGNRTDLKFTLPRFATGEDGLPRTHLGVWGDMGTVAPLGFKVFDKILADHQRGGASQFNATMLFGDISYAGIDTSFDILNISSADELEYVWDCFGEQVEPLAAEVPFMVGVGNHDMFYNGSAFATRFHMPWEASQGEKGNFWYSFDIGSVHVISSSSEHDYGSIESPQLQWLAADLERASANRDKVPWIVFTIHKPMYSADKAFDHATTSPEQMAFEPLLVQHGVDLVLVGHEHCYERIHPVVNGSVTDRPTKGPDGNDVYHNTSAPTYVVVGSAGAMQEERWIKPTPDWSAVRFANGAGHFYTDSYGYGSLVAHNATHLSMEFVPISGDGVVSDFFWITK